MSDPHHADGDPDPRPDFGPSGYLPARAATRARKIVLRAPLGLQWIIGAVVAGALVVVAGVVFLQSGDTAPAQPWIELGTVGEIGTSHYDDRLDILFVAAGGRIRAFADAAEVDYCSASNRLERPAGGVWALTGRGLDGTPSLREHPVRIASDLVYVDPTTTVPLPDSLDDPVQRGC